MFGVIVLLFWQSKQSVRSCAAKDPNKDAKTFSEKCRNATFGRVFRKVQVVFLRHATKGGSSGRMAASPANIFVTNHAI